MDYFVESRYIGTIDCEWHANLPLGNESRAYKIAQQNMTIGKRRIPAGTKYWTIVNQICGKYLGTHIQDIKRDINQSYKKA